MLILRLYRLFRQNLANHLLRQTGEPGAPAEPSVPPCTLNIVVESVKESLLTSIVSGKSVFAKDSPENDKLPLNCPDPSDTTPPKDGVDIVDPPAFVIVMSLVPTVAFKFC